MSKATATKKMPYQFVDSLLRSADKEAMPARVGIRCLRRPRRLHRTASLRHQSSIDSRSNSSRHTVDQEESGPGTPRPEFLGGLYQGSTPVIEETPDGEGSDVRSTPCPRQRIADEDDHTPRSILEDMGVLVSDTDRSMRDASQPSQTDDLDDQELDQDMIYSPASTLRRHKTLLSNSNATSIEQRGVRNATANNHRARLAVSEMQVEADREWHAKLLVEMERSQAQMRARTARLEEVAQGGWRPISLLLVAMLSFAVLLLLMYAYFCWLHWPEMSYIRKRRQQVLGM